MLVTLLKAPKSSPWLIGFAILAGLAVAAFLLNMVFTFAWYASGLAAEKREEELRQTSPIDVQFPSEPAGPSDPND